MSVELLTKNEFNFDVKSLIENIDVITAQVDLYSIIVDEKVLSLS